MAYIEEIWINDKEICIPKLWSTSGMEGWDLRYIGYCGGLKCYCYSNNENDRLKSNYKVYSTKHNITSLSIIFHEVQSTQQT